MADGALTTIYSHLIDALASNAVGTMCAFLVNAVAILLLTMSASSLCLKTKATLTAAIRDSTTLKDSFVWKTVGVQVESAST